MPGCISDYKKNHSFNGTLPNILTLYWSIVVSTSNNIHTDNYAIYVYLSINVTKLKQIGKWNDMNTACIQNVKQNYRNHISSIETRQSRAHCYFIYKCTWDVEFTSLFPRSLQMRTTSSTKYELLTNPLIPNDHSRQCISHRVPKLYFDISFEIIKKR